MLATGRDDRRGAARGGKNGRETQAGSRFEVLGRAGEGTLWIVYRVRERATGQVLALKALKGAFNRHGRFPTALMESCSQWCGLQHHHLAAPQEVGREDDTLFFTGEWLSGGSLEARLTRSLSRDEIVNFARAAASVLFFLHGRNLTHGDVRPRQFVFDSSGNLKLTDAGVATAFGLSGLALADVQPDAVWYLAPERTQGAVLAPPSDIYAFGVILYRMLAGRVPFDGPSPLSIALRHRSDAPLPPSQFNPRCPADLEQLALQLLEKDPAKRPDAASIMASIEKIAPPASVPHSDPITPGSNALSTPIPPTSDGEEISDPTIKSAIPRRRPLSPIVEETLAAQKEEELVLDRETLQRRHRRREFWGALRAFLWLFVVLGAFGGMFLGAYKLWLNEAPRPVRVPNYLGLEAQDAKQRLAKAGLTMVVARETYDAKKPEGTVVSGQPEPGRLVRSRRQVSVTVSQGEAPITMVDFTELPLSQARGVIAKHAMRLGPVVEQFHDKVPRGFICGQYPEAGEPFRRSEPITLIVSRGPQPSEIDVTTGTIPPEVRAATGTAPEPLPEAPIAGAADDGAAITRVAVIRVQIPADGGSQPVRIIVRDNEGEREIYNKTHRAGDQIEERVRARRAQGATALVRVYVGQSLIKEEQF
ncbi:MAG TPA: protein kinase [Abditibacterium sp.]|jgi:serine/threonine-protein kinase